MTTATDAHTYQSTVLLSSSLHCGRLCVMPTTVSATNTISAAISATVWRFLFLVTNSVQSSHPSDWQIHHTTSRGSGNFSKAVTQLKSSCRLSTAEARFKQFRLSTSHAGQRWKKQRWFNILSMLRTCITQGCTIGPSVTAVSNVTPLKTSDRLLVVVF